jgi:tetratricopeptide (TPR) repeat protein
VRYPHRTVRSVVLSFAIVAWAVGPAGAAPAPRVSNDLTREFQAGVDAFRLGKYDEARAHLEKAEALDPKLPGPHRFLAAVARAQRRYADCITEARRALQLNPQSREVAGTRKLHDECRAADGRPAYTTDLGENAAITVTANVSGATVRIGALRYGGTPVAPRLLKAGFHELEIEKLGWRPAHLAIDALPGIITDVDVTLEPADAKPGPSPPAAPPSAPAPPAPAPPAKPPAAKRA